MSHLNIEVPLKSMRWPVLMPCSAAAPFSGWSMRISRGLYTSPSIVFQSVPRILRRTNKEEPHIRRGLQIFKQSLQASASVFHFRLRIVLILNFSAIRLFSLLTTCWYGIMAIALGFPPSNCGFRFGCRARRMSLLLYPFCLKTYLRCCSPPPPHTPKTFRVTKCTSPESLQAEAATR